MKTIGHVLRENREKQGFSQSQLARHTHVAERFIRALEDEDIARLPAAPLTQGYLQLLAKALGITEESLLALYRRDLAGQHGKAELQPSKRRVRFWHEWLSPRTFSMGLFGTLLLIVGGYFFFQWQQLGKPPLLVVDSPVPAAILSSPVIVEGKTDSDASLVINTQVVSLDPEGRFRFSLDLPAGERSIVVHATDRQGRKSEVVLFVTVE